MGGLLATERKYFDATRTNLALTAPNTWAGTEVDPPTLNTLFCPVEGSDINERIGRKVSVLSIKIRGTFYVPVQANQTATDLGAFVRFILFQDLQTNGSQAQGEELMTGSGVNAPLNISQFQSTANFGRFRVLKDKVQSLRDPQIAWDGTNIEQSGYYVPFKCSYNFAKPVMVRFNSTNGGSVADIVDNSFHMIAMIPQSSLAPEIYYVCRTVYVDV